MKPTVVLSICTILLIVAAVPSAPHRGSVLATAAAVAASSMLVVRLILTREQRAPNDDSRARDPAESLRRWLAKTETLVARAETTRADWDKHLRPMLARQFELATGQRRSRDAKAFHATAQMVFGPELWRWVDPDNVSRSGFSESAPGRDVLDEVLLRLERI